MDFQHDDFLQWTRDNEWGVTDSFHTQLADGTGISVWDSGVMVVTPAQAGDKDIVLSAAVHGNETAPVEICRDIINDILAGKQAVKQRTLFLFANPASINAGQRFVEENMNRLFSGAHSEGGIHNRERERAAKIEQYVTRFYQEAPQGERRRYHYDLHTAIRDSKREKFAVYPYLHGGAYKIAQLQFLRDCGVTTILLNQAPTTTFSYFTSRQFGADAFTVELGKVRGFGENDRSKFAAAETQLRRLISQDELTHAAFEPEQIEVYDVARTINRTQQDFSLAFADDVANFTPFNKGELLAMDGDKAYHVEHDEERIIFPNANVAIGQRALLTVIKISTDQLTLV